MAWWPRLFSRRVAPLIDGEFRVPFRLYSPDAKRSVELRERRDGMFYFVEQTWNGGTVFRDLTPGKEFGPYDTAEAAEEAAVSSPWFRGEDNAD